MPILATFREIIRKPNGIVLVTGPDRLRQDHHALPRAERTQRSHRQVDHHRRPGGVRNRRHRADPHRPEIGNTFAHCLRSILRQDPDKILVGEIRDLETAEIAVQASLTGHMVFSTLHTNDAPSTVTRLRDMGVPPFLITATLEAVLAQRLVRKSARSAASRRSPARTRWRLTSRRTTCWTGSSFAGAVVRPATTPASKAASASTN